jgi:hypothetical protein
MAKIVKQHWSKGTKILGAAVFILLMFFNLQIAIHPNRKGKIDLFGVELSLVTPSAFAEGTGQNCETAGCSSSGDAICGAYYDGQKWHSCPYWE